MYHAKQYSAAWVIGVYCDPFRHRHLELSVFGQTLCGNSKRRSHLLAHRAPIIHQLVSIFLLHADFLATMLASFPDLTIQNS